MAELTRNDENIQKNGNGNADWGDHSVHAEHNDADQNTNYDDIADRHNHQGD